MLSHLDTTPTKRGNKGSLSISSLTYAAVLSATDRHTPDFVKARPHGDSIFSLSCKNTNDLSSNTTTPTYLLLRGRQHRVLIPCEGKVVGWVVLMQFLLKRAGLLPATGLY